MATQLAQFKATCHCLAFAGDKLVAGFWDGFVRVLDVTGASVIEYDARAPVLSLCIADSSNGPMLIVGCADGSLHFAPAFSPQLHPLSTHTAGIPSLLSIPELGVVAAGSWDGSVAFYDLNRAATTGPQSALVQRVQLTGKVFSLSYGSGLLAACTSGGSVAIIDVRKLAQGDVQGAVATRDSPLKGQQPRAVLVLASGAGYALAGCEGKVAVEPLQGSGLKPFSFKAHRKAHPTEADVEEAYPINCAVLHPVHGTVATGGADGAVAFWDLTAQKRISIESGYGASVTALALSPDGKTMVVAAGEMMGELVDEENWGSAQLFVRQLGDNDVKPRAAKA